MKQSIANQLYTKGYCVFPVFNPAAIPDLRQRFRETLHALPEYNPVSEHCSTFTTAKGKQFGRWVIDSFGAIGSPSSFHNLFVRQVRLTCYMVALPILCCFETIFQSNASSVQSALRELSLVAPTSARRKLQMLYDRMSLRPCGSVIEGESFHRDHGPFPSCDTVFGGWVNLDASSQFFACIPETHKTGVFGEGKSGFMVETEVDKSKLQQVEIPAGHAIMFYQDILHMVRPGKVTGDDSMRVYMGYRLTPQDSPQFEIDTIMDRQTLPPLPSGQMPWMYASGYGQFHMQPTVVPWSNACIRPEYLVTKRKVKDGQALEYRYCPQKLNFSLVERGLGYGPYTEDERVMMKPHPI